MKNIGERKYAVTSYFTGDKNIDEILTRIAVSKAYAEIESEFLNNEEKNLIKTLAKGGLYDRIQATEYRSL